MSGDFALLRCFDPAGLRESAGRWRRLSAAAAEESNGQHRHRVSGPLWGHWQGKDADSAFFTMGSTEQKLEVVRVEAESVALVLDTVADRMDQARTNLSNALLRADEWHLPVADDGTVGLPPQAEPDRHDPDAREERQGQAVLRDQVQDRINSALTAAREASDQGAHALGRLSAGVLTRIRVDGAASESAKDVQDVAGDLGLAAPYIPENKDPQQSAAWWKSLTPEQQQSYITLYPEEIGRLDGLPATVRDQANRLVVEQQLDTLKAGNAKGSGITYEEWNQRQTNLRALKEALDKGDAADGQQQLFLLQVDASGDGKAVVSTGNPDTADHTAVLVPGTGTTMTSTSGQIDRIGRLQDSAERAAPGSKVAVISWLGYDAPEFGTSVLTPGRAEDGAEDLRRFTGSASSPERPSAPTPPSVLSAGRPSPSTPMGTAATGIPTARA
ncbi:alpha/beta hydrolase [Kitasatospora cineracea]|uniref:alpha/beta hydrolase n=1 Tax=Kitasatospora cineracea TaxID=88074 RepID=UPI00343FB5C5